VINNVMKGSEGLRVTHPCGTEQARYLVCIT
jgi:hypothetical protein